MEIIIIKFFFSSEKGKVRWVDKECNYVGNVSFGD